MSRFHLHMSADNLEVTSLRTDCRLEFHRIRVAAAASLFCFHLRAAPATAR